MATQYVPAQVHYLPTRSAGAPRQGVWTWLRLMARARHTRRLLAEMDDRMLSDIGVSRADAHMEASRPAWDTASPNR